MQTRPSSRNSVKAGQRLSILDRLGEVMTARQPGRLLAHAGLEIIDQRLARGTSNRQARFGALAVDRALDRKQRVDAAHDLDGDRREPDFLLSRSLKQHP